MPNFKILIAEDDRNIRNGLLDALEFEGYTVKGACDGAEAIRLYNEFQPDLLLLDVMMPQINGYDVCRRIRRNDPLLPIIMLTAKAEEIDKVLGLELGADDYVTKPFSLRELCARITARLRIRTVAGNEQKSTEIFSFADWQVDPKTQRAVSGSREVELTQREIELLRLFAGHPDEVLKRQTILKQVWGSESQCSRTLDQHLVSLRRKLGEDPKTPRYIETVYGRGYRFKP